MLTFDEAIETILSRIDPLGTEPVTLLDALGRVSGETIFAGRPLPPWDHSAMDGYALRSEDTERASPDRPARLAVIAVIPAGTASETRIGPGQAARIMTGAPIPPGADAVMPFEDVILSEDRVCITVPVSKGRHIRKAGQDVRPGEPVLGPGDPIRPPEIGLLAALGHDSLAVRRRPVVGIVATGDELEEEIAAPLSPAKIVASNCYVLAAQVQNCGAVPLVTAIARDTRENLALRFREAEAGGADLIVSSGGVSKGDYDLVKVIMQEAGNCLHFWQVAMKPGLPFAFGSWKGIPLFGLPGPPVATMTCFDRLVRPAILRMLGCRNLQRTTLRARLEEAIQKEPGLRAFIQARIRWNGQEYTVSGGSSRGPGMLRETVWANGIIVLPEETTHVQAGHLVDVQFLDDPPAAGD